MTREETHERFDPQNDAGAQAWGLSKRAVLRRLSRRVVVEIKRRVPREPTSDGQLAAGAAVVDITPPPGLPMAGYSVMGQLGQGMRTRLKARALYIRPHQGRPVALVVCDLLSGSSMLHHRVAELVAATTDVDLAGLMVAGTHTHSAPGNYYESVFYNSFASGSPGFDAEWFRFLSERVARAVTEAFRDARPARLASGSTLVPGATENRSPAAYARNQSLTGQVSGCDGVNPWMHMIRVDCLAEDGRFHPRAAFSSYSIHPTALDPTNSLYNGDVFAWVERRLEDEAGRRFSPPWPVIHAAANHTHGDCTPSFSPGADGGFVEARRVGEMVGDKAVELFES
ncbi:MAG: neutral/alkaline non-lysosomal ceramidase N-terminal domain-containing protein, partial [Proteobacteria bacterium]|nr:neutral/alkaline non-lysosomal ceramidase N-terminal domain-containing protein [Pseudomonadota bacterium]